MKGLKFGFVLAFALVVFGGTIGSASAGYTVEGFKANCLRTYVCGQRSYCEAAFLVFETGSIDEAAKSKGIAAREYTRRFKLGLDCLKCCATKFIR